VNEINSAVDYYTGTFGSKQKNLATYIWTSPNVLSFTSVQTIPKRQGITVSATFPKGIFSPYEFSFWELYGQLFWFVIPLILLIICLILWALWGKDPNLNKPIIAEYEAPDKLTPLEMGLIMTNGKFKNKFITAEIIYLATRKILTIKESERKIYKFRNKIFIKNDNTQAENSLNKIQKIILKGIFGKNKEKKLSALERTFYPTAKKVKKISIEDLIEKKLITKKGLYIKPVFLVISACLGFLSIFCLYVSPFSFFSVILSAFILLLFGFIMPQRTLSGAELYWKIKGFKLFMETVDKHRAEFYEKENIFEKFLPYAITFGITKLWIKKMEDIYGKDFYSTYQPTWYSGKSFSSFNVDSLNSVINSLSSNIASSTSSSFGGSGTGGSGGASGGGGGGGGGGW